MRGHPPQGQRPRLSLESVTSQGAIWEGPWLASARKLPLLSTSLLPIALSGLLAAPPRAPPPFHPAPMFLSPLCHPSLGRSSLFHPQTRSDLLPDTRPSARPDRVAGPGPWVSRRQGACPRSAPFPSAGPEEPDSGTPCRFPLSSG